MKNIAEIIEPTPEIANLQEQLVSELTQLLPHSKAELIGAMAVPMVGRPELDVLIISEQIENDSKKLVENGYRQGPVVKGTSHLKKMLGAIEIGVQVMSPGNKMIEVYRGMIRLLRDDPGLRTEYETFKKTLSGLSRDEYKDKKSRWIRENILPRL